MTTETQNPATATSAEDEPCPLYEMYIAEVYCLCDAWAADDKWSGPGRSHQLIFASLMAPMSSIKGIRAALNIKKDPGVAYLEPYVREDPRTPSPGVLGLEAVRKPIMNQGKLQSIPRSYHAIIATANTLPAIEKNGDNEDEEEIDTFYVIAKDADDGPRMFYKELAKRSPTPTLPEWADIIWTHCVERAQIRKLPSWRIEAWRCKITWDELEAEIQLQVANGKMPMPL